MDNFVKVVLALVLITVLLVIGPVLTIWSLNTLFPVLAIGYTWQTWCAVVLLGAFMRAQITRKK